MTTWTVLRVAPLAWGLLFLGIGLALRKGPLDRRALFLFLAQAMMLAALLKARRFIEYWPTFAVIFFAATVQNYRLQLSRRLGALALGALLLIAPLNAKRTVEEISANAAPMRLSAANRWLRDHTPKGAIVYNAQWDIFPELLFHNHHNRWVQGLDPNFTYFLSEQLYALTQRLEQGRLQDMAGPLSSAFEARYALAQRGSGFDISARRPGRGLRVVFEDSMASVFEVLPADPLRIEAELWPRADPASCEASQMAVRPQDAPSAGAFLRCTTDQSTATLRFDVHLQAGRWRLLMRLVRTPGAEVSVWIDDVAVFEGLRLSGPGTLAPQVKLPARTLEAGKHRVELRYALPKGGTAFGVDYLQLERAVSGDRLVDPAPALR